MFRGVDVLCGIGDEVYGVLRVLRVEYAKGGVVLLRTFGGVSGGEVPGVVAPLRVPTMLLMSLWECL